MFETETNPHYREDRADAAAPFHRDEQVRIGKAVHLAAISPTGQTCFGARISGHPMGRPDENHGRVFLAIDVPPYSNKPSLTQFEMWRPRVPGDRPQLDTWHWARACPDGL